ncbi:polyketide synthase [Fusarium mexicanum]|uniref:Polyketide synthase n=1 Tax=Fusarium mexicanum TaxID=751941 RepID=A0A8H5MS13_9HYPO|nr:polyketide synthase [Fusarium mexicanum]
MSDNEPIAVIGSACRFPGDSSSPSKLWDLLKSPRDLLTKVPSNRFNADAFYHADSKHHGTTNVRHSYFLNEDPASFDNNFFNIQPGEAEAIDPQQRLLMEVVYQGLCASGQTIEGLRGSPTSVYVGVMCDDWSGIITRDLEVFPQYGATGMARSIMSNRISYFFDWHGPSMTIDTACSSSLVAVHQAIQTLRSGESEVAIAAGANLILTPGMYVAESKLSMLSPSGRSKMWDQDVNGYARGEGIAAVVLKPLSAAIRDNDHIDCIIRATGVNQDGRTPGLTMPSATAQADLIRSTYARAGLDINKPEDRPQFFHAHGTGTPAGDPREAEAIYRAFYSDVKDDKLYVGSIKTVLGHTEGTAGLASLIGTALAIQNKTIPPNMHFDVLNPKIKPFYDNLEVPTKAIAWPETHQGQPRRASINSFGFGGTNAHAIIESYEPGTTNSAPGLLFSPLTFSASSESSLRSLLASYSDYLKSNPELPLQDLAYTLQTRRSTLAYRVAITASDVEDVYTQLDAIENGEQSSTIGVRQVTKASPKIMGVFTGQGAQWPRMGARLIEESAFASQRLSELDEALSSLPKDDRPSWTLREMILADSKASRIAEAAISQPLCTAVQVVLVDLLRQAGVELSGVVGHSSGEIGAAYAAGLLTARDAIRVAYYRGLYAKLAQSPNGRKGAMMAVGTTFDDASEFCELDAFQGRIQVAARNSSSSITLSGDEDAIVEAIETFKDEGKFARQLKVDTAYHSSHVLPCAKPYLEAMERCQIERATPTATKWYSSVHDGQVMTAELLAPQYWVDNMTSAVLFSPAVEHAWQEGGPYDLIIEVGPHAVLKTPCLDTLEDLTGDRPPYTGVLGRGKDDIQQFANGLGFIWTQLGAGSVTFERFEKVTSDSKTVPSFIHDLPNYPFDHARQFMSMSRVSGWYNNMQEAPHPILGRRCHDRETSQTLQWRNVLSPKEIPWLHGHQIQGQIIFPATGYLSMAVEAVNIIVESKLGLVTIEDLRIGRALAFSDDDASVESMFDLRIISRSDTEIEAEFSCYSGLPQNHTASMVLNATAHIKASLSAPTANRLPNIKLYDSNLREVQVDRFYDFLGRLGYNYSWPFHGTTSIRRKANLATGTLEDQSGSQWEDQLLVHPGMLDTSLQTTFAAYCCPGDERMWALHLPTSFRSIVINPYFTSAGVGKQKSFRYQSVTIEERKASKVIVELNLLSEETGDTFLQIEGMELVPFSPATPENDAVLFSRFDYRLAGPDGELTAAEYSFRDEDYKMAVDCERIAFYYLRRLVETITPEEKANTLPHYRHLVEWAAHVVPQVVDGVNPHVPSSAQKDTHEDIQNILKKHYERVDVRLLESVGENLPQVIRGNGNILEHMTKDGMLDDVYEKGFGLDLVNKYIAHMTAQIAHRYPRMNILEIGAGTGGSTREILPRLGSAFSTYTYTDVSGGFFDTAQDRFKDYAERMIFKTFDMNISPGSQGFTEGSYDLVIASNVLHATLELEDMMKHVRSFLKPGGFLIILETVNNDCLRVGLPMGSLPGWWLGAEHGRRWGPTLTLPQWDSLLWKCGFGGIDTTTPPVHKILPGHVFCAQALDERVEILRSPLSHLSDLPETKSTELAIVGGETLKVHRMCEQISRRLKPKYSSIARFNSIEELNTSGLADSCTVLSLTELDEPLFANMTSGKLDALKTLWKQGGSILWVTTGARDDNPHSYMTTGVGRCMRFEYPNITLQALDIKTMTDRTPELIADHLLRLELLDKWSKELRPEELLWSLEPEIYVDDDTSIVPRLYPYESGNSRYNAERRNVLKGANLETNRVVFVEIEGKWEVQHASPLHIPQELPFAARMKTIRITHFSPATVNFAPGVSLMLCVGIDTASGERLLAATHIAESPVSVAADLCIPLGELDAVDTLANVSAFLTASTILKHMATEETLVIHDAPSRLASALEGLAKESSVTVFLTTSDRANTKGWQYIDSHLPERVIKTSIPRSATKFINLSQDANAKETGQAISGCLPRYCETINTDRLFSSGKVIRQSVSKEDVSIAFNRAFYEAKSLSSTAIDASLISLKDISGVSAAEVRFAVVDCTESSIEASVRPIGDGRIFQADKTFLLIGLSGELGQSLCKWMVEQGARNIVLTSRRPNVSQHFFDEMATTGATVKALPMDITNRDSLHACVAIIQRTLPPIAGVVNGAMVLRDALFENMAYQDFLEVLRPKVHGSQLLDEMFYDTPLDFFIFFSSTTAVMGNSGQSNYIAGNMFMNALAAQRKKRGVAASSIDISSIIGLGYVERAEDLSEDTFIKMGYKPMSEQDLQKLFAEAIVLGRPECDEVCELVTGVTPIYTDAQASDQYLKDVKFGHFLMERLDTQGYTGRTSTVPVRVQLADVKTKTDAVAIIKDAFIVRLRRVLAVVSFVGVFFKDLEVAYTKHTLPSLPVESQYRSFALQQRQMYANGDLTKSIEYYRKSFPKDFTPIQLFPFAISPARQFANDYSQHEAKMSIDPELATKVRQLARVNRSTSFHVYLAALELLLFTLLPNAEEVFIGIADANRGDKKFMDSLGFFLNLLPLRFRRKRLGTQLSSIIQTARDTVYGALQQSQLPFDVLLRELNVPRSDKYTPIFQVFMDYRQVVQERSSWGGCRLHGEKWHNAGTGYDIALEVNENITTDTLLGLRLQKQLYSEEHTAVLLRSYLSVLEYMVQGTNKAADAAPAWSKDDLQVALDTGKAPEFLPKWQSTISHHIDQIIQRNATKVAIKDGSGTVLTYEQMGNRVNSIAQALIDAGTTQGTVVGVFQEPSSDWICSLLAIFKAGAVYVPLDLRNSIPRLTSIVKASRPSLIITDHTTDDKVELIGAKFITQLHLSKVVGQKFKEPNRAKVGSLAVILFTSGSTGEPKGLMMTHTNLMSYAEVSSKTFSKPDESLVVLQQSPFSFDFSLDQTVAALANGGCLCVVPASKRGDPDEISKIMVKEGVTYTTATPSEYDLWLRYSTSTLRQCTSWRYAFSGGEAMSHKLAREFGMLDLKNLHVFNGYGPAETTILSHRIDLKYTDPALPDPLPAGFPMPGFSVCIVDEKMRPVPLGVQGEIVLGGPCIVSGYLNMPDSTKDKFLPDTFFGTGGKVYRSGDRGRLCRDGLLFCDGRLEGSNMIKLRGFRVELDEVEKTIISHSAGALSHAVVTLRGTEEGRYLAAHVVFAPEFPEHNRESSMKALRQTLPLPPYMRPSVFQVLADIPRTAHLKIDRKAIQEMPVQISTSHDSGTLTVAEQRLSELWRRVLPLDPGSLSPESDFFLIGGNSILLVKLQALLRQTFKTAPRLVALMGVSKLGAMAVVLESCGSVAVIDWDRETALPDDLQGAATLHPVNKVTDITVLLTGSAGYLGRHLLPALVEDPRVTRVHCLVRSVNNEKLSASSSSKVRVIESDLSKPELGLSALTYSRLAEETDVIIHSAANRSFWDRYEVLKPDNMDPVKELVRFAASSGRSIPLHFLSSGAVKTYEGDGLTPPADGSDGYVATKWASETFLRNAAGSIGLPVYAHRPTASSTSQTKTDQASIVNELFNIVKSLGVRPSFEGVTGSVDVLPIGDIVRAIQDIALSSSAGGQGYNVVQHEAHQRAFVEDFVAVVRADDSLNSLPSISILDWFGKAKKAGFSYFLASQNLVMGEGEGHLVSRR